jgi:serine/threonine-protein kinase
MGEEAELNAGVERRIGATLRGKYRLEAVLGVGGMAAVYRATNMSVGRACAVKILHREISGHAEIRARFLREGLVANTVGHRGAVDVVDGDVAEDGSAFLVMELLSGASVESLIEAAGGRASPAFVASLAFDLLGILGAAHAKRVVHRDIKPANLFITEAGELKVLDFGIAQLRDGEAKKLTRTGLMMGTPGFMAPEQALGKTKEVGPPSDIWSVGATMFTMISGRSVHEARTPQEMLIYCATQPAPSLATVAPEVSAALVSVVDRALAFYRDQRWTDASQMRSALESAYRSAFGSAVPSLSVACRREKTAAGEASAWETTLRLPPQKSTPKPRPDEAKTAVDPRSARDHEETTTEMARPGEATADFRLPKRGPRASAVILVLGVMAAGGTLLWRKQLTRSTADTTTAIPAPAAEASAHTTAASAEASAHTPAASAETSAHTPAASAESPTAPPSGASARGSASGPTPMAVVAPRSPRPRTTTRPRETALPTRPAVAETPTPPPAPPAPATRSSPRDPLQQ